MQRNKPLLVGVTGGIGSGKSTICRFLEILGVPVYYADDRAKELTHTDELLAAQITAAFGSEAYESGRLNRTHLAKLVFNDKEALATLNSFIHPAVKRDFDNWTRQHADSTYLVKEAALIYEINGQNSLDRVIVVTAPENLRIQRVLARDSHRTEQDIRKIIGNQLPEAEKCRLADYVLVNDGKSLLIPKVLEIHTSISLGSRP